MKQFVNNFAQLFPHGARCQRVFSSTRYLCVQLYFQNRRCYLFIGRGNGYEGLWLSDTIVPASMRTTDSYVMFFRKHILNKQIKLMISEDDRIFCINSLDLSLNIFYKGREVLLSLRESDQIFTNWDRSLRIFTGCIFSEFKNINNKKIDREKNSSYQSIEQLLEQERNDYKNQKENQQNRYNNKVNKKIKNIASDIKRLRAAVAYKNQFIDQGVVEYLADKDEMTLEGFKIRLRGLNPHQKRVKVLEKIKLYEKAIMIQEKRLSEVSLNKKEVKNNEFNLYNPLKLKCNKKEDLTSTVTRPTDLNYTIYPFGEFKIGVGNNSQGNDQLRKWATKEDIWVHLSDQTSAHMIIKFDQTNDANIFQALTECARLYQMKMNNLSIFDLIYTKIKYVRAVKGASGLVRYTHEKILRVKL